MKRKKENTKKTAPSPPASKETMLSAATHMLELGLRPIPVDAETKKPLIKWKVYQKRSPTREEVERWWTESPESGLAILTGTPGGVSVIDLDAKGGKLPDWPKDGKEFPRDCVHRTLSGGRHCILPYIEGVKNSTGKLAPHVDVRGEGGYVLVPPTRGYTVIEGSIEKAMRAKAPEWLADALLDSRRGKERSSTPVVNNRIPEGQRNETLFKLGCSMRGNGMNEESIRLALLSENRARCDPPLPETDVTRIARSVVGYPEGKRSLNSFALTDSGNAEAFAMLFADRLRYDHKRKRWLVFKKHWWVEDPDGVVNRFGLCVARERARAALDIEHEKQKTEYVNWAIRSESRMRREACIELAKYERPIADDGSNWDADPFLFGVRNGVVDLRTGKLRDGRPEDRITRQVDYNFDPMAKCPLWKRLLKRVMAGNTRMIGFIQRLGGMCLTGDIREHILPIFYGEGNNGKNVLLDTWKGVMGPYAGDAPPNLLTVRKYEEHPTEIADLCGQRLVVASETEGGARLRVPLVKRLTGDRTLKGRFMRKDYFEFPRTHKTILVTNNRPSISENTVALWRRIRLVPFEVVIPERERDDTLTDKLRKEYPGILNWLIRGCLEWQKKGLQAPKKVLNATEKYEEEEDVLGDFVETRCRFDPRAFTPREHAYTEYRDYAEKTGERYPLSRSELYERLRRTGKVTNGKRKIQKRTVRGFCGIEMTTCGVWCGDIDRSVELLKRRAAGV